MVGENVGGSYERGLCLEGWRYTAAVPRLAVILRS